MITKLKNLFTNAAQNTGSFANMAINYSEGEEIPKAPNPADVEFELPPVKTSKSKGVKEIRLGSSHGVDTDKVKKFYDKPTYKSTTRK